MIQIMDDTSLEMKNRRLLEILAESDREIAELQGLIELEGKFWITDAGKQQYTSGLLPDMVQVME